MRKKPPGSLWLIFNKNFNLGRVSEVKTDLEKGLLIQQAMMFQAEKIQRMQSEIEVMKPKAFFMNKYIVNNGNITIHI